MLVSRSFSPLRIGAALLLAGLALGSEGPLAEAAVEVRLRSAYLADPLGHAHQVTVEGALGGSGRLVLDPNTCTVDAFGDPAVCTELAPQPIPVALRQAKLADPSGARRRLYRLQGATPEGWVLSLVVPRRRSEPHRLVVDLGEDRRRVITLEALPAARPAKPAPELGVGTYDALRVGSRVFVHARGQNPSPGYETFLEHVTPDSSAPAGAPHLRLLRRRPPGMAPTVMTDFEARIELNATTEFKEIVVTDAKGRHLVPVRTSGDK